MVFDTRKSYSDFLKANFWVQKSFLEKKVIVRSLLKKHDTHTLTSFFMNVNDPYF